MTFTPWSFAKSRFSVALWISLLIFYCTLNL
jgi:hypothetical protein